jgi:hydroxymethylpyrimidine pyrophosphatase-like HAD family hydrolase
MGDWKLIALDMDGTLLGGTHSVSEENIQWIRRAREMGVLTTLATGRMYRDLVLDVTVLLGIDSPLVTANGGEVWTASGQLLERHALDPADIEFLMDLTDQYHLRFWACPTIGNPIHPETLPPTYRDLTYVKFGFYSAEQSTVEEVWRILESQQRYTVTNSDPLNIEVNPLGVTKASGLARVCRELGILAENVVAIGDSFNDIPMLEWAGMGIAMGNAQEPVKRIASAVTADNAHHGVARAIERILSER